MRRVPRIWKAFGSMAAITIVVIIQACAPLSLEIIPGAYRLVVSFPQQLKHGETAFANALQGLNHHPGVSYDFHLVRNNGTTRDFHHPSNIAIKTDRVITTEL